MKRIKLTSVLLVLLFGISSGLKAQSCEKGYIPNFRAGNMDLNFGLGLGGHQVEPAANMTFPLLSASVDYALRDDWGPGVFGVGGFIGFERFRREYGVVDYEYGYNYTSVIVQGRATYHYQFMKDLDTYVGLGLGLRITGNSFFGPVPYNPPDPVNSVLPSGSIFAGGKYYFQEKMAAFCELGIGTAYFTVGLTVRL